MPYKQPRSIQVVIFSERAEKRLYLLLRRVSSHGGFWQSVTGSLEDGETHVQAAVREVREETGFGVRENELIDLGVTDVFEIAEQWLSKYARCHEKRRGLLRCPCEEGREVQIDRLEHDEYMWVDYDSAVEMLYREAIGGLSPLWTDCRKNSCRCPLSFRWLREANQYTRLRKTLNTSENGLSDLVDRLLESDERRTMDHGRRTTDNGPRTNLLLTCLSDCE
jgi:dATP pyrophosphohydrolase